MKIRINARIKKFLTSTPEDVAATTSNFPFNLDVCEEYANAFRTESYNDFWTRVLALSDEISIAKSIPVESTTAARLSSYRLFVEHFLDPDQPTVTRILALAHNPSKTHSLLTQYFIQTANAFLLCASLLKDIDHTRVKYRSLKTTLQSMDTIPENNFQIILTRLTEFANSLNPFHWSAPSPTPIQVRAIQTNCSNLLKQLESSRDEARTKLQLKSKLKHSSALFLVALTASLTVILATHALALLVAAPSLVTASLEMASSRRLARMSAQLDMAAKGTYIMSRDLETISRLVARLNDEVEHMRETVTFWVERGEEWVQANGEVVRQLKKNNCSFSEKLDELEEHLYLCFMTINRARNLVLKEILDPGQPIKAPNIFSK